MNNSAIKFKFKPAQQIQLHVVNDTEIICPMINKLVKQLKTAVIFCPFRPMSIKPDGKIVLMIQNSREKAVE